MNLINIFNLLFGREDRKNDFKQIKDFLRGHLAQLIAIKDKIPEDIFDVTKFFLEEDLDIYESIDILMRKNHFRGCIAVSRPLFENSINLQYIYKTDSERRAKNFKLASTKAIYNRFRTLQENSPEYKEVLAFTEDRLKDYIPDKKRFNDKADEIGSGSFYKDAYKRLSEYIHSGYKPNRDISESRPYNDYLRRLVFADALMVTLESLKVVCERYDLEGGVMVIDEPGYKGTVLFATNTKKAME